MAQSLPKARQGLGEPQPKGARVLAPRLNPPHAQKTMQSGVKSPDGLLRGRPTNLTRILGCALLTTGSTLPRLMKKDGQSLGAVRTKYRPPQLAALSFAVSPVRCFQYRPLRRHIGRPILATLLAFGCHQYFGRATHIWQPDLASRWSVGTLATSL